MTFGNLEGACSKDWVARLSHSGAVEKDNFGKAGINTIILINGVASVRI